MHLFEVFELYSKKDVQMTELNNYCSQKPKLIDASFPLNEHLTDQIYNN